MAAPQPRYPKPNFAHDKYTTDEFEAAGITIPKGTYRIDLANPHKLEVYDGAAWQTLAFLSDISAGTDSKVAVFEAGVQVGTVARRLDFTTATDFNITEDAANDQFDIVIANNAITFAKQQDIATDRLVGRDTAATGDPEEITVGGGVEFTGASGIQRSALTGEVTAPAGSNATTVAGTHSGSAHHAQNHATRHAAAAADDIGGQNMTITGNWDVSGIIGRIVVQTGAGAPSHTEAEGTVYWDTTNNILYVNDAGVATWTLVGPGGGSAHTLDSATHSDVSAITENKGDILVWNGTSWVDLNVGTNEQQLTADSATATGLKWAAAGGAGADALPHPMLLMGG